MPTHNTVLTERQYKCLKYLHTHKKEQLKDFRNKFPGINTHTLNELLDARMIGTPPLETMPGDHGRLRVMVNYVSLSDKGLVALHDYKNERKNIWHDRIFRFVSGFVSGIFTGLAVAYLVYWLIPKG